MGNELNILLIVGSFLVPLSRVWLAFLAYAHSFKGTESTCEVGVSIERILVPSAIEG
jgi:hypothetical protein